MGETMENEAYLWERQVKGEFVVHIRAKQGTQSGDWEVSR
jgi:hypothetical protein